MRGKKAAVLLMVILVMVLVIFTAHVRIIKLEDQRIFLFDHPFHHSGGSVGSDIRDSFDKAGKSSDRILNIEYIGTNSDGNYFECTYKEADGAVSTYYAFDDGDLNSTVRAAVLW